MLIKNSSKGWVKEKKNFNIATTGNYYFFMLKSHTAIAVKVFHSIHPSFVAIWGIIKTFHVDISYIQFYFNYVTSFSFNNEKLFIIIFRNFMTIMQSIFLQIIMQMLILKILHYNEENLISRKCWLYFL